jgi:hypothetical protein
METMSPRTLLVVLGIAPAGIAWYCFRSPSASQAEGVTVVLANGREGSGPLTGGVNVAARYDVVTFSL